MSRDSTFSVVLDSKCLYARNSVIKKITKYEKKVKRKVYCFVLLEFQEELLEPTHKLKFKKLSEKATVPRRATDGSVGYDLYSAEDFTIFSHGGKTVATDIVLVSPPGVYPRIVLRSSFALKNTNVGAGVLDVDYRGYVKVIIMNHSSDFDLKTEAGNRIAQFILTRYETPDIVEVTKLDSTARDASDFGSSGL